MAAPVNPNYQPLIDQPGVPVQIDQIPDANQLNARLIEVKGQIFQVW